MVRGSPACSPAKAATAVMPLTQLLAPACLPSAILYWPHPRNPRPLSVSRRGKGAIKILSSLQDRKLPILLQSHLPGPSVHAPAQKLSLPLCKPTDCSPPCSSVHGILQERTLEWGARAPSRGSSRPWWNPRLLCLLHQEEDPLPPPPPGKSQDLQRPAPKWRLSWPSLLKDTSSPLIALFYWLKALNGMWNFVQLFDYLFILCFPSLECKRQKSQDRKHLDEVCESTA